MYHFFPQFLELKPYLVLVQFPNLAFFSVFVLQVKSASLCFFVYDEDFTVISSADFGDTKTSIYTHELE